MYTILIFFCLDLRMFIFYQAFTRHFLIHEERELHIQMRTIFIRWTKKRGLDMNFPMNVNKRDYNGGETAIIDL